mgnify:CR=1 FL=1
MSDAASPHFSQMAQLRNGTPVCIRSIRPDDRQRVIAAFLALWKYQQDIMKVIGVCALLGLAYSFLH